VISEDLKDVLSPVGRLQSGADGRILEVESKQNIALVIDDRIYPRVLIAVRFGVLGQPSPLGSGIAPGVAVWVDNARHLTAAVFDCILGLPTYVVPGRAHRSQVARLHAFATLLAGDAIDEQGIAKADAHLIATTMKPARISPSRYN
jgi:hypothetical protein